MQAIRENYRLVLQRNRRIDDAFIPAQHFFRISFHPADQLIRKIITNDQIDPGHPESIKQRCFRFDRIGLID